MHATATSTASASTDAHLLAAAELLDRHGTADPTLGLTMRAVAEAAGLPRAAAYRSWETSGQLNDAVAIRAIERQSWALEVAAAPASHGLGSILGRTLEQPHARLRAVALGAVSSWPNAMPGDLARAHERHALAVLARWLDLHLDHRGARWAKGLDARCVAIALHGVVEGSLLIDTLERGSMGRPTADPLPRSVGRSADLILETAMRPGRRQGPPRSRPVPPEPPPPAAPLDPAASGLVEVGLDLLATSRTDRFLLLPRRVVDIGRLARTVGISDRRLYMLWPTAADLNAALFVDGIERHRARTHAVVDDLLRRGFDLPPDQFDRLCVDGLHQVVASGPGTQHASHFSFTVALLAPSVRERAVEVLGRWQTDQLAAVLAALGVIGATRRPETTLRDLTSTLYGAFMGLVRLRELDPTLVQETLPGGDGTAPVLGAASLLLIRALAAPGNIIP